MPDQVNVHSTALRLFARYLFVMSEITSYEWARFKSLTKVEDVLSKLIFESNSCPLHIVIMHQNVLKQSI